MPRGGPKSLMVHHSADFISFWSVETGECILMYSVMELFPYPIHADMAGFNGFHCKSESEHVFAVCSWNFPAYARDHTTNTTALSIKLTNIQRPCWIAIMFELNVTPEKERGKSYLGN